MHDFEVGIRKCKPSVWPEGSQGALGESGDGFRDAGWDQQSVALKGMAGNFCFVVRIISFSLCHQLYFSCFYLEIV